MSRKGLAAASVVVALALAPLACKKHKNVRQDEALKSVVDKDRQLAREETNLLNNRGRLQRERVKLRDKRAAIASRRATLADDDQQGKTDLDNEETKLKSLETRLATQEVQINQKLQVLLEKKSGLVEKAGTETAKALLLARREHSMAWREREVARREAEVARREKLLADREQGFAGRQARLCPGRVQTVVQTITAPPAGGGSYRRRDVEPVYRAALRAMRTKGILTLDLPPGVDRLITEVRHAVSKGQYTKAKYAADQLLANVRAIRINRGFIGAKIARLSARIRRRPPADKARVQRLFAQATGAYGDGRFRRANSKLNEIYGLLR